jgi:excisionase family DNA binding protein
MIDPHRFFTPSQVWHLTGAPRALVYEALRAGDLRAIHRGSRWLVPGAEVVAWIGRAGEPAVTNNDDDAAAIVVVNGKAAAEAGKAAP